MAERLVELMRALPNQMEGMRCGAYAERGAGREAGCGVGRRRRRRRRPLAARTRSRARAERTLNMEAMLVTSDVSKLLSVWLNTDATCRVTTQEEGVQCGARCGPGEAEVLLGTLVAAQSGAHGVDPTHKRLGGQGTSAHGTW